MPVLRQFLVTSSFSLLLSAAYAQQPQSPVTAIPTAESIMTQVAANQDRAVDERRHYLYVQHARILSRKGTTVQCEEITDSRVTPSARGSDQQLLRLSGRMLQKHKYVTYTTLPPAKTAANLVEGGHNSLDINIGDSDSDRDFVESMRSNLTNDQSKDGLDSRLFPLTSKSQADYLFHLVGRERVNGREVFHIEFRPKDKDDFGWKGDAFIDTIASQPVVVRTAISRRIPFAVRTLLGTNLPGLGFTVVYAPLPDGTWFPTSFGTEFKIHVLFLYSREIVLEAQNRDFEKTHVSSKILGPGTSVNPP